MTPTQLATALAATGRISIPYRDKFAPERALSLECYRPADHTAAAPVVIVQHGQSRNGREYCDAWIPVADRVGALIVAITFPKAAWPDAVTYNNGHVLDESGGVRPREAWSQAIPGRVLTLLREAGVTGRSNGYLWGHSAGGQFVHRLLATQPHGLFAAVGAANSGWYTLPTLALPYPDGYGGIGLSRDDMAALLGYPLTLFAGDRDIDGTSENFPQHESAMTQGAHRFARAHFFLARGRDEAAKLGVPCNWQLITVPGIGHQGMRMAAYAAKYWFTPADLWQGF
ncbi:MAG TPA: alpha/beta hydrolase [Stellaceae bacterium]|nr:alpha/beta hydrolase [Stellaceae bacterium]